MKKVHRKILVELMEISNSLGGVLDGTSTHETKYKDRQRAHMLSYKVLYAVLSDHPENDNNDINFENAKEALEQMRLLKNKIYPDRTGRL